MAAHRFAISGIDIGNTFIKVVVAALDSESGLPRIIGAASVPSRGVRRGAVVDMEETIDNVRSALQQVQAKTGTPVQHAYVSVNGPHIRSQVSRGVIAVSRADNEIAASDIDRVVQAASIVGLPSNREVLHVIPRSFTIDGTEIVRNPLGMKGVRLEAEVLIIDGLAPYVRNVAKCVEENGVTVAGLVYAPLAASLAVLDKGQREYGVMNLDIGGATSTLAVFEESDLVHSAVLPVGSHHMTRDIAIALRTSLDAAERIKLEHAVTSEQDDPRRKEVIDLSSIVEEEHFVIPKRQLARIVDARAQELLELVSVELKKVSRFANLPAGVVLSGGGANLPGLAQLVKDSLRLPVRMARLQHLEGITETAGDPSFTVACGLAAWGLEQELSHGQPSRLSSSNPWLKKSIAWIKNFLP